MKIKKLVILVIVALISVNAFADRYRILGYANADCMYMNCSFKNQNYDPLYDNPEDKNIIMDPTRFINTEFIVVRDEIEDEYKLIIDMIDITSYGYGRVYHDSVDELFDLEFVFLGPNVIFDTIEDIDISKCRVIW